MTFDYPFGDQANKIEMKLSKVNDREINVEFLNLSGNKLHFY